MNNDRKGVASCLGTAKVLLVNGENNVVEDTGDILLQDSKASMLTAAADQEKQ